ncbi:MAG TPA: lysylphosphatidylglycerol synthase transmembrane domain-containing protein [Terriglobia bacterium]|nr:lysylphosphatidylglycerol synthase transmembrane domain-containing protein [Terriglobia bacterium]
MNSQRRALLSWLAGAAIIAIVLYHLVHSAQWRNFDWGRLAFLLTHVKIRILALAFVVTCTSYLVRAYRWQFFVDPIKRCSLRVLFAGQVLGFTSIYLVGRAGEIVRPGYIAKKERIPFMSQLAVLVLERVYDSFALVALLALALYVEPVHSTSGRSIGLVQKAHAAAFAILIICGAMAMFLVAFRVYSEVVLRYISRILNFTPRIFRTHLMNFLVSFSSGLDVIQNPWDFAASLGMTAVLWVMNVSVFWLTLLSLGGHLANLSWWAAGLLNFFAALGLVVQLPGVGGGFQVAVLLALENLFHVSPESAAGAAILAYLTIMVPCLLLGLGFAAHEGLTFSKLKVIAEVDQEAAANLPQPHSLPQSPSSEISA